MKKGSILIYLLAGLAVLFTGCSSLSGGGPLPEEVDPVVGENLERGWKSLWNDDFNEARDSFASVLEIDPSLPEALRGKALSLFCLGDYYGAADLFLEAIQQDPASPCSVPMRDFVWTEIPFSTTVMDGIETTNQTLRKTGLPLWIRREGIWGTLDYYDNIEPKPELVRKESEKLGVITDWNILGPFQNISHCGFDKSYIDETDIASVDKDAVYTSDIDGISARWISPGIKSNSGEVFLSQYLGAINSTYYAESVVQIEQEGDYVFIFTQHGALKCWIDDEIVLVDSAYRAGAEIHWIQRTLTRGEHHVLVKMSNRLDGAYFGVALERVGTAEITRRPPEAYMEFFPDTELTGRDPLLESLASLLDGDNPSLEDYFWFAFMLSIKGYNYEGLSVAAGGRKLLPFGESALFDFLEYLHYASLGKEEEAFRSCIRTYNRGSVFAPSMAFLIREYLEQERWSDAEDLIERSEERFGSWFYGAGLKAVRKAILDGEAGAEEEIDSFQTSYPDSPWLDLQLLNNPDIETETSFWKLVERIEKKGRPIYAQFRRLGVYIDREEYGRAYEVAKSLTTRRPEMREVWEAYIRSGMYSGNMNIDKSLEVLDQSLGSFPLSSGILHLDSVRSESIIEHFSSEESGTTAGSTRDKIDEAEERLRKSLPVYLTLNPEDFTVRDRLRELNDREDLWSLIRVYKLFRIIDKFKLKGTSYDADSVTVLDEDMDIIFQDGGVLCLRQDIIKVLSRQGVRSESTFFLDYDPGCDDVDIDMACIVKSDGAQVNAVRSGRRLSFPGLEAGDYIVVSYSCTTSRHGTLMGEIWDSVLLNDTRPVFMKDYTLVYPPTVAPTLEYHNADGIEIEEETSNFDGQLRKLEITVRDTEPVRRRRWSAGWQDEFAWLDISTISDWETVADWYRDIYTGQCRITPDIERLVAELTEGAETREEMIARIYAFVSGAVDYEDLAFTYNSHVPQTADSVLEDRYGDCKDQCVLLITMLKAAGIDSYMALSAPGYRGDQVFLPSPRFSHVFVVYRR